jgi:hypothetical protein
MTVIYFCCFSDNLVFLWIQKTVSNRHQPALHFLVLRIYKRYKKG